MLKPIPVDNDVESESEDLGMGVNWLYSELLYSVGEEIVRRRASKAHKDSNKENMNQNRLAIHTDKSR